MSNFIFLSSHSSLDDYSDISSKFHLHKLFDFFFSSFASKRKCLTSEPFLDEAKMVMSKAILRLK